VRNGLANGVPWKYYDLDLGFCTEKTFAKQGTSPTKGDFSRRQNQTHPTILHCADGMAE
jgi:hypothetical protein